MTVPSGPAPGLPTGSAGPAAGSAGSAAPPGPFPGPALATSPQPRSVELLELLIDPGSWQRWDSAAAPPPLASEAYRAELVAARDRCGLDESVVTGAGLVGGRRLAVVCNEFGFLAGSIGVTAAERLLAAIERATAERLPLLAVAASGGTRMQEGTLAFLRMPSLAAALAAHRAAGLAYLVYLRHPTTGGVLASWASLGQLTAAEPGALIGFLGPKVYAALHGERFPAGVQTAENLLAHGSVDAVLPPTQLRGWVDRVLGLVGDAVRVAGWREVDTVGSDRGSGPTAWESVQLTRRPERPGARDVLARAAADLVPLTGTGRGEPAAGLVVALARWGGVSAVVIGQDRVAQASEPIGPGSLRAARRAVRLAAELRLPLVTLIDTPGGELSVAAEQGALAGEIASCLAELAAVPVPTVSVLLGQGSGGAALALFPADRVLAARHAWLTPLPPEGASVIVHGTPDRAAETVAGQSIRAVDLRRAGAVDRIVDEHPDAAVEPVAFCQRVADAVAGELSTLVAVPEEQRLAERRRRHRHPGASDPGH